MKHKIVLKEAPWAKMTREMVDWVLERNPELKDKSLELHDPLLVECVETLNPPNFRIVEIEGDEYLTLETTNDVIALTPSDIEILKKNFIKIDEQEQDIVHN